MNILFFFSTTGIGGTETNFAKIGLEFKKNGHNIIVIAIRNEGNLFEFFKDIASSCTVIGPLSRPVKLIGQLKKIVRKNEIDVVFNFGLKVEIISRIFSKRFGVKKIVSNIRSTDDWRKSYHNWLDRITSSNVDIWVSNSNAGKVAAIKRNTIIPELTTVIYNYVDFLYEDVQHKNIDPKNINLGVLSNIKHGKGFEDLINLSQILDTNNIKHTITIAGVDRMNGKIHTDVLNKGLADNFIFLGFVKDKQAFFKEQDIIILPTYWEGLPTSLLEAMAAGIPIITTKVGGIPEIIIDGENGFLLDPGDIDGFYNAINLIVDNNEIVEKFRKNGHDRIKNYFSKSRVMHQWLTLLDTIFMRKDRKIECNILSDRNK